MCDQVFGNQAEPFVGADHRLDTGPLALQTLAALGLLGLGDLLEVGVDLGLFGLRESELGEAALVVDRHGGTVLHGALDVVGVDVVAEDGPGVLVGQFDGRAGEADKGGVRQGLAHAPGKAVDEVVLAAVGLVGDHHDVGTLAEQRMGAAALVGQELLNRGEDDATRGDPELGAQVVAALGLCRSLVQKIPAAGEGAEELVV